LPLLTVQNRTTGEIRRTTDLGRALNTRLWADIGKVRVLGLRGLASRAPYFHAGQAKTIGDVLKFYATRFNINFTAANRADLEAFLLAL
jgi:cytochrome c peroxidase